MTNLSDPSALLGCKAIDSDGDKFGSIEQVFVNDTSGLPEWDGEVRPVRDKESFAPLQVATDRGDDVQGRDTSGPTTDDAMTLSAERLKVGTQQIEPGRARLRKYIVTEDVTQTVPLRHEEVRLVREPITDANVGAAMSGGELTEEEHEITLDAERPVVAKEAVPAERVRLRRATRQARIR